jgi:hypothetical protein
MALFLAEADKSTTTAEGHVVVTVVSTVIARVTAITESDLNDLYEEYNLFTSDSIEKREGFILRRYATGDVEVTCDAINPPTGLIGLGKAVTIEQQFPASSPKAGIKWYAPTCLVQVGYAWNSRGGPSLQKWSIKPYGTMPVVTPAQAYIA